MARPKSERGTLPGRIERRAYGVSLEVRAGKAKDEVSIEGYASVTEEGYTMSDWAGDYTEVVRQGAFAKTLSENPAVQLLLNHGGLSMAYTKAGSLRLAEDDHGLHIGADVNTQRHDVSDMVHALRDGDVDEMSFAFYVRRQQWSPDYDQRDILEVDIHKGDVSVVNFGANPATTVDARAAQLVEALDDESAKALHGRLSLRLFGPPAAELLETGPDLDLVAARLAVMKLRRRV